MTRGKASAAFLGGLATAALVAAAALLVFRAGGGRFVRVDTSRPVVVSQMQRLQRLETVVYGIDRIVTGERAANYLPRFLAGDRLILIVFGQVIAGVDLARIRPSDVSVEGRAIRVHLPEPEIFSAYLDESRTRVYSRDTGLFTRVDPDLESDVRKDAEQQIRQAALEGKILDVARRNAGTTLTSFVQGLGYDRLDVW
jgi:hypothetical protein